VIFWVLVGVVVLSPFPLASVQPWGWGLMACVIAALLIFWSLSIALGAQRPQVEMSKIKAILIPFALATGWAALQAMPIMPDALVHPLWDSAAASLATRLDGTVSIDPAATVSALARLLAYGGIFWLSLQYCRERRRALQVMVALALAGLVYGTYGLFVEFSGTRMVLWFEKTAYETNLTSTFINRNSYATYAGLTLLCAIGILARLFTGTVGDHFSRRESVRSTLDIITGQGWLVLVASVVIATALLLTESRGGFLSAAMGILALIIAFGATRTLGIRYAVGMALAVVAIGGAFFLFSGEITATRLAGTSFASEERASVYGLTLQAIGDSPLIGTGLGTFEQAFRMYRDESISHVFDKAHNTYLELALELGLPAAALLLASVAAMFGRCVIGVRRRRRDTVYPCIGVAATVLVAVHSLVDFSLQIPAVAATYALLMGAAVAQTWRSRESARPAPREPA
jgi:O-antigen ligase